MKKMKQCVFITLLCIAPIHNIFSSIGRLQKVAKLPQKSIPKRPFKYPAVATQIPKPANQTTLNRIGQWLSARKNQFLNLNWYKGRPASVSIKQPKVNFPQQKELAVPINLPQLSGVKSEAQIESEEILAKLREKNPWNYSEGILRDIDLAAQSPLAKQIEYFLEKNSVNEIAKVFSLVIVDEVGNIILRNMIANNKAFVIKTVPLVEQNAKLMDPALLAEFIFKIPSDFPEIENLKEILFAKIYAGEINMHLLLESYSTEDISKLLPHDTKKFVKAIEYIYGITPRITRYNESYILPLMAKMIDILKQKMAAVAKNDLKEILKDLLIDQYGYLLFRRLMVDDPFLKDFLIDLIKNEDSIVIVQRAVELLVDASTGEEFVKIILDLDGNYANTSSYRHLIKYYRYLKVLYPDAPKLDVIMSSVFKNMVKNCLNKEKEAKDKYEIFYHARRWQYGFLSDLYGILYSHQSEKQVTDFIFTHLVEQGAKGSESFLENEKQKRERLLKEGNPFPLATEQPEETTENATEEEKEKALKEHVISFHARQSLLFLNKFLFGNLDRPGSCSIAYMLKNYNMGDIEFSIEDIFKMFGYGQVYKKYEKELVQLQQDHARLSQYGEMLQILIPKENVDKYIYYTTSAGPKQEFDISGVGKTTDINKILKSLNEDPKDIAEFVLVNTRDQFGGLNPDSGIKIFSHNLVDPEKMAAFKVKEKELFDRIRESLKQYHKERKEKEVQAKNTAIATIERE